MPDTGSIFALAYASALKKKFQLDVGEHYCILTSPVTERGMAAGDLIYQQITNYLIYKFADALLYSDNPCYTQDAASAGSYIQQLRSYIEWVKTTRDVSQVVVARLARARDAATAADKNFSEVLEQAETQWIEGQKLYPTLTFSEWADAHYPPLAAANRRRKSAQIELDQAMQLYFGPDAGLLVKLMDNIKKAQSLTPIPGHNMDGLVDDQDLINDAIKCANGGQKAPEEPIVHSTIRVPAYAIPVYISKVYDWIEDSKQGATRDQVIAINADQGRNTTWQDYGFKEIQAVFGPFFFAEVYVDGRWETRTLDIKGRENDISLELAMIGIQKFDIKPGEWDIPNVKNLYPIRLPGAPNALAPQFSRIVSVLAGYDVELKVTFGSDDLRDEVNHIYEEVKTTKGRMSVFGFSVGAGVGGNPPNRVETKFSDVKWDHASGSMSMTPTKGQVYPTILGVVAQRFD